MKSNQNKILNYANHLNPLAHALAGGGNAPLYLAHYQTHEYQNYESIIQKFLTLGRFTPHAVIKALKMPKQSKRNKSARSANSCPYSLVIARFGNDESWQSIFVIRQIRFCAIDFIYNLKSRDLDCHALPKASLAMTISSSDSHKFKSRGLDTSLRINATLSMTNFLPYYDKTKRVVILRAIARSIHFGDFRILCDSLTLGESTRLRFTRFTHFGLLRRLQRLAMTIRRRFAQFTRFATFHTTLKGIKMQT